MVGEIRLVDEPEFFDADFAVGVDVVHGHAWREKMFGVMGSAVERVANAVFDGQVCREFV